jgi:acyl-CoA synthetase (AMP-forming)/AMP-acid ligase II
MLLIDDVLAGAASAAPNRVALTLGDDAMTFSEMRARSNRLANALWGWGVRRGDRVAYWSEIDLEAAPLQFALGRLGAAFAPLNPAYTEGEAADVVAYLNPRLLIAGAEHSERADQLAHDLDLPVATSGGAGPGIGLDALSASASAASVSAPRPAEDDIFTIFLTSGSTGRPKGAMISQRATWLRAFAGSAPTVVTGGQGQLVTFPLFHMAGWTFAYYAWSAHQPAHLVARADGALLLDAIERLRPACLYCIPAVWRRILDEPGNYDVSSLEWALIGTSRVEVDLLGEIKKSFPETHTTVSYGSTEVCRALCLADGDLMRKPGSVGLPTPGVRTRIGEDGELWLDSPTLMTGYFDLPDDTARALAGGWYHTGDLVEQDDEGYFSIVGRKREIIRSGGESVAPTEVEAALADYPGVADVAVMGVPDSTWGEVVCAAVVMADGLSPPSVEAVRRHLTGRLASFKHPRRVVAVDELPRTAATGQIQRSRVPLKEEVG